MKQQLLVPRMRPTSQQALDRSQPQVMRAELHPAHEPSAVYRDRSSQGIAILWFAGGFVLLAIVGIIAALGFAFAAMEQSQDVAKHALDTAASIAESAAEVSKAEEGKTTVEIVRPWWSVPIEALFFIGILIVAGIAAAKGGF